MKLTKDDLKLDSQQLDLINTYISEQKELFGSDINDVVSITFTFNTKTRNIEVRFGSDDSGINLH